MPAKTWSTVAEKDVAVRDVAAGTEAWWCGPKLINASSLPLLFIAVDPVSTKETKTVAISALKSF